MDENLGSDMSWYYVMRQIFDLKHSFEPFFDDLFEKHFPLNFLVPCEEGIP